MQNRLTRIALCAVGALVLVACGSDSKSADTTAADRTTAAVVETAVPSDTAAGVTDTVAGAADTVAVAPDTAAPDNNLEGLLITAVPPEYTQIDDVDADTGPSDLAKAVRDDGSPDAEAVLTDAGFMNGYQRAWQTADQNGMIIVFLYEFSNPSGAASYGSRTIDTFDTDATLKSVPFQVDGIPDASGRSLTNLESSGGIASTVVFTQGGYLVQIVVVGTTETANQALAQQLAADQFSRL